MPDEVDAIVGLPIDGAGKQIATKEVTRADGAVVHREEVVVADPSNPSAVQRVHGERGRGRADVEAPELAELLTEIRDTLREMQMMLTAQFGD